MSVPSDGWRQYHLDKTTPPTPPVGTRVCGRTADGERFTWYVVGVDEDGKVRVSTEKPTP